MSKKVVIVLVGLALFFQPVHAFEQDFYDETVLRTLQLEFSQPDWWSQLQANYESEQNIPATLIVDGVTYEGVGVRFRGLTSYMMTQNSKKKSFNIEIDYTIEGQRLMGYKTLNLINCFEDPTFMREPLYSNVIRRQIPSAKANFVILQINGENWGIYANIQQLNAEFVEDWFPSNDGTRWRAGWLMVGGGQFPGGIRAPAGGWPGGDGGGGFGDGSAALTWLGSDPAAYEVAYELKSTKQDDPWESLINTCDVLNNTPLEQLPGELEKVLNVDRALWLCAFEIIFHDDDGYIWKRGSDYFLYYEPETGSIHVIQYDANSCMRWGNTGAWSVFLREDEPVVPLMYRLMAIGQYRQRYLAHVRTILSSYLTEQTLFPKIDAYRALIEEQVKLDNKKLYSYQQFVNGVEELKNFVRNRRDSLFSNRELGRSIPEIIAVSQEVAQNNTGQQITITAHLGDSVSVSNVDLYIAEGLLERFKPTAMVDDGLHGDGQALDGVFVIILPDYPVGTVLRYYVQATANDGAGTLVFDPEGAEYHVYTHVVTYPQADVSPVVINELMARNNTTIADPQGDYDDWIELLNVSNQTVDLSGMYLSDNPENPLKWQFPEGTTLKPGDYLLVWADEDGQDEPGLHANFKLSASKGETVWLYDTDERDNMLLDSVTFGAQSTDISVGRYPDGTGPMQVLVPSPLGPNEEPPITD